MKRLLLMLLVLIPFAGCEAGQGDRSAKSEDSGSGLVCFGLVPSADCKAGLGDRCAKSEDCATNMVCFAPTAPQVASYGTYADLEPYLDSYTCVGHGDLAEAEQAYEVDVIIPKRRKAAKERAIAKEKAEAEQLAKALSEWAAKYWYEPCHNRELCRVLGKCSTPNGIVCIAASDDHCRASERCKTNGRCTAKDGECIATSDPDCRASEWCKEEGICTLKDGTCKATSDADCRASEACKNHGNCTVQDEVNEFGDYFSWCGE